VIARYGKFEYALAERYRFEEELGRGAMGTVYRARDVRLGRPVAIKLLHPLLTNELGIARFQSEIRIVAGLHHPNIIGIHDCGEVDGQLYYVMDYLGGETLRARLDREKQLPIEDALWIAEQVASGLQYAHERGVVHRDVKPENILLADGRACIVDFGLAIALGHADARRLTDSGISVGTPGYLSPEQASAERDIGPKADQYSLAIVLYEMLAGDVPFTGPNASVVAMRHISEDAPPLRNRRRMTPAPIEAAVMCALQKIPADRFGSIGEFSRALATAARNTPPPGGMTTADFPGEVPDQRQPRRIGIAARLVAFAAVGLAVAGGYVAWRASRSERSQIAAKGSIRIALVPVIPSRGATANVEQNVFDGISTGLRLVGGSTMALEPLTAQQVETNAGDWRAKAHERGVKYVASIWGLRDPGSDIRVELIDVNTGDSFGSDRVPRESPVDARELGGLIAVTIARSIAVHDSIFGRGFRTVFQATRSARALVHLIDGQQRFGKADFAGASSEFRHALEADSGCGLAFYRLSVVSAWDYHYAEALAIADSGLRQARTDPRTTMLLRAQRFFAMQMADSAIAGFARTVADDPDNIDGWYGLSQAMYNFGWIVGYRLTDARPAFDRVARLDSTYAPLEGLAVDVALSGGDTASAKAALPRIEASVPWRAATNILVDYATAPRDRRDSLLAHLGSADQYTLSELVIQLSRTLKDVRAADRVAVEMLSPGRTPESRRRGRQYRLAFAPALNAARDSIRADVAQLAVAFDSWVGAAALAGVAPEQRQPMRDAARRLLPVKMSASDVTDGSRVSEAIDYLVQDALDEASTDRARAIRERLAPVMNGFAGVDASVYAWDESLKARLALSRADTAGAIAALQQALLRSNAVYGGFFPLASLPTQRRLLEHLLIATKASPQAVATIASSFERSWSIADALFSAPARALP
jgi:hypothetical protein